MGYFWPEPKMDQEKWPHWTWIFCRFLITWNIASYWPFVSNWYNQILKKMQCHLFGGCSFFVLWCLGSALVLDPEALVLGSPDEASRIPWQKLGVRKSLYPMWINSFVVLSHMRQPPQGGGKPFLGFSVRGGGPGGTLDLLVLSQCKLHKHMKSRDHLANDCTNIHSIIDQFIRR